MFMPCLQYITVQQISYCLESWILPYLSSPCLTSQVIAGHCCRHYLFWYSSLLTQCVFSVLLKGEGIHSVSIPKAEESEFSPLQIFRGIQACTKSQPSGDPQALAECPALCSCCQSLHGQWKASCPHCSKVVLQHFSSPPEECCKPEEMFSFLLCYFSISILDPLIEGLCLWQGSPSSVKLSYHQSK